MHDRLNISITGYDILQNISNHTYIVNGQGREENVLQQHSKLCYADYWIQNIEKTLKLSKYTLLKEKVI